MIAERVSELCKTIRRPGGTIDKNDAGAQVANPGIAVSHKSLKNMQLLSFWLNHMERISRPTTPTRDITPEAVESLRQLREREKNFVKPTDKPKIDHKDCWFKTMEAIKECLAQCPGLTKIPLAYVVRDDVEVPVHASDPRTAYTSHQHEMIRRAPHGTTDTFKEDRELVFMHYAARYLRELSSFCLYRLVCPSCLLLFPSVNHVSVRFGCFHSHCS